MSELCYLYGNCKQAVSVVSLVFQKVLIYKM